MLLNNAISCIQHSDFWFRAIELNFSKKIFGLRAIELKATIENPKFQDFER